ncbi:hypothetical protein KM043_007176, partial [Ampulex compressa]
MTTETSKTRTWKEHNRLQKEQRKKWKEERLIIKANKAVSRVDSCNIVEKDERPQFINRDVSTVSIALPGSILDNAQSPELRTYLAGQIARAACVYQVDEIVIFDDQGDVTESERKKVKRDGILGTARVGCLQLARILQYLECPQYLRKYFFPLHKDLQYAGVLNPLDTPHHLRQQDLSLYREGVVTNKPIKPGKGSQVNVGLLNDVHVDKVLTAGLRVTVRIPPDQENSKKMKGFVVPPNVPRSDLGVYWGYSIRLAQNLTEALVKCPYKGGYDMTIGTSDKGTSIDDVESCSLKYDHVLIVFGGLA